MASARRMQLKMMVDYVLEKTSSATEDEFIDRFLSAQKVSSSRCAVCAVCAVCVLCVLCVLCVCECVSVCLCLYVYCICLCLCLCLCLWVVQSVVMK